MSTSKRVLTAAALVFGLSSGLASAQTIQLNQVAPNRAPADTAGRNVTLGGNFDVGANTGSLQVFWSNDETIDPSSDLASPSTPVVLTPQQAARTQIQSTTPSAAAGSYEVYVSLEVTDGPDQGDRVNSNTLAFTFVAKPNIQAIAEILLNNFSEVDEDGDGVISQEEAENYLANQQGIVLTQADFNEIEGSEDGLTQEEIEEFVEEAGCPLLGGDISQLFIFGILAFFLGLWQSIRNFIVGLLFPFPGNPLPPGVD